MKLGPLQSIRADAAQPVFRPLMEFARAVGQRRVDAAADRARTDHADRNRLGELGAGAAVTRALQPAARNAA